MIVKYIRYVLGFNHPQVAVLYEAMGQVKNIQESLL